MFRVFVIPKNVNIKLKVNFKVSKFQHHQTGMTKRGD